MYILRKNKNVSPFCSVSEFLSNLEIDKIFDIVSEIEYQPGLLANNIDLQKNNETYLSITSNINAVASKIIRSSNIKWIENSKKSNWLYEKLADRINIVNSENYGFILKYFEDIQFTEYKSAEFDHYRSHTDSDSKFSLENYNDIRKLSFSIQLSDPESYSGGELKIYLPQIIQEKKSQIKNLYEKENNSNFFIAEKKKGSLTFFPSDYYHEVMPVTEGVRFSLVGWVSGPNLL